ncbi:glycine oxidase ThiO [Bacillus sp. EB600]|uniref:glycine oxidase ThiO n=1 Tax=Bacillus sp. EB600 TaxID=2806345 RepID=UPI002108ACE4|nr:glycine oxidase ThiO [Bacillus sp. EB600]
MNKVGNSYDVVIVGGGVNGSSIAYQLSKMGRRVLMLEKGTLACQASSAAAGMLAAQAEIEQDGPFFQLALKSQAMFPSIAAELFEYTGIDIELIKKGMLKIAESEDIAEELKKQVPFQRNWDPDIHWLDSKQVLEMEPALTPTVLGAMYLPHDGNVMPAKLSLAFAKAAEHFGTEIREHTEVVSFICENGRVTGVKTTDEVFSCDQVVVATGAWASELMRETGIDITVYPVKGECFSVKPEQPIIGRTIFSGKRGYLVPKRNGEIYIGATVVENPIENRVTAGGIAEIVDRAIKIVPQIKDAPWERVWSGIRPQTGDGYPYIGEHPHWKGLFVAAGHFRNGILLSPITGKLIAQLLDGSCKDEPLLSVFRLNRAQKVVL